MISNSVTRVVSVFRFGHKTDVVIMSRTRKEGEEVTKGQRMYANISTPSVQRISRYFFNNVPIYASATFDKGLDVVTMTFKRPLPSWMR